MLGLQKGFRKAVEKVIGYLDLIRTCATEAEQMETAIGSGLFVEDEVYTSNDFLSHEVSIGLHRRAHGSSPIVALRALKISSAQPA